MFTHDFLLGLFSALLVLVTASALIMLGIAIGTRRVLQPGSTPKSQNTTTAAGENDATRKISKSPRISTTTVFTAARRQKVIASYLITDLEALLPFDKDNELSIASVGNLTDLARLLLITIKRKGNKKVSKEILVKDIETSIWRVKTWTAKLESEAGKAVEDISTSVPDLGT